MWMMFIGNGLFDVGPISIDPEIIFSWRPGPLLNIENVVSQHRHTLVKTSVDAAYSCAHQRYRDDANDHAERSQKRASPVCCQLLPSNSEAFRKLKPDPPHKTFHRFAKRNSRKRTPRSQRGRKSPDKSSAVPKSELPNLLVSFELMPFERTMFAACTDSL